MTLQEIETRMSEIDTKLSEVQEELATEPSLETEEEIASEEEKVETLETEVETLKEERASLIEKQTSLKQEAEKRAKELEAVAKGTAQQTIVEERKEKKIMENIIETKEYRNAFFKKLMGKQLTDEESRAMTTAAESVGSVIPTTTLNRIEELLRQTSALYPYATVLNVPGYLTIPTEKTTNAASWVEEGHKSEDSDDETDSISFAAYKLIRTVAITAEVSAMSIDAFEAYIIKKLTEQMAIAIENAIVNGSGNGQPKGILKETYDQTNSIEYSTMDAQDITGIIALLKSSYKPSARFSMSGKTLWGTVASIVDENNKPVFIPNVEGGFAGRIFGIPVIENDYIEEGTVILGDFSKYTINFNSPIQLATDTSVEFRAGDKVYRAMALLDGKVVNTEAFVVLKAETEVSA